MEMRLQTCPAGHFYDKDKDYDCPYCMQNAAANPASVAYAAQNGAAADIVCGNCSEIIINSDINFYDLLINSNFSLLIV
jgi:hypothetical protein